MDKTRTLCDFRARRSEAQQNSNSMKSELIQALIKDIDSFWTKMRPKSRINCTIEAFW